MFRIWGKIWKDNHLLQDITICDAATDKNRTRKVFDAIEEMCYTFDLSLSGWRAIYKIFSGETRQDLQRTPLLMR